MDGNDVANFLIQKLLDMNFIIHRYNSYTTSSIYLKLDYGMSCGIRIADHPGKKKYHYRFNIIKDYEGSEFSSGNNLVSFFFNYDELDKVLEAVKKERQDKINKYGLQNYKIYMEKNSKTDLFKRFVKVRGV